MFRCQCQTQNSRRPFKRGIRGELTRNGNTEDVQLFFHRKRNVNFTLILLFYTKIFSLVLCSHEPISRSTWILAQCSQQVENRRPFSFIGANVDPIWRRFHFSSGTVSWNLCSNRWSITRWILNPCDKHSRFRISSPADAVSTKMCFLEVRRCYCVRRCVIFFNAPLNWRMFLINQCAGVSPPAAPVMWKNSTDIGINLLCLTLTRLLVGWICLIVGKDGVAGPQMDEE